jgi:hypothetical protein
VGEKNKVEIHRIKNFLSPPEVGAGLQTKAVQNMDHMEVYSIFSLYIVAM